jgi:hypothetical protein
VKFTCLVCSRTFKGSQSRADRGVCSDCEPKPQSAIEQAPAIAPVAEPEQEDQEFVPMYARFKKEMTGLVYISECLLFAAVLPMIGIFVGLAMKNVAVVITSFSLLISIMSLLVTGWITGHFIQIVIDMANNLQRIADRK